RRVFNDDLISGVAVAHPKFVGTLLIPRDRRSCAVDLNVEPVLSSGRNLAGGDAAAGACAHAPPHMEEDGAEVFSIYGGFNIFSRAQQLVREGLNRVFRPLARGVEGLEISAERGH